MIVTYHKDTRTYSITDLDPKVVHVLIWGGEQTKVAQAERELRAALVKAEDEQMPEDHYRELFNS